MNHIFRTGIKVLVVIIVVLGGLYLVETYSGWRPFGNSTLMADIKRGVGILPPVESRDSNLPPGHEDTGMPNKQSQIFRCRVNGKTIYSDVPCDGARSKVIDTKRSAGIETADPLEVAKFRAEAFAAKLRGEPQPLPGAPSNEAQEPVPSDPSTAGLARARCEKLESYIAYLDGRARQPLSAPELAQIKREKKDRRQQLSDLDCMHA